MRVRQRARLDALFLQPQAHGAAQVGALAATLDLARLLGAPFGDQADHRVGGRRLSFSVLLAPSRPASVARHVDHGRLHAVADAEIRDLALARAYCAVSTLPSKPRSPKPPGTRMPSMGGLKPIFSQRPRALDVAGLEPFQVHPRALADAAVLERLAHGFVGVLVVDVLADHGDGDLAVGCSAASTTASHSDRSASRAPCRPRRRNGPRPAGPGPAPCSQRGILWMLSSVDGGDHRPLRHVGEQRDLAPLAVGQRLFAAAQQHVRLDADASAVPSPNAGWAWSSARRRPR